MSVALERIPFLWRIPPASCPPTAFSQSQGLQLELCETDGSIPPASQRGLKVTQMVYIPSNLLLGSIGANDIDQQWLLAVCWIALLDIVVFIICEGLSIAGISLLPTFLLVHASNK
jgi:hypothetical protein